MERTITQRELRNDNAKIIRALEGGASFIVTRNGVPVGRLTPVARRTFVPATELMASAAHLPALNFNKFRIDIDAHFDQDPAPRV
ncbi:MAG: prevent-host-death protein [Candidatus Meridianibacter frigidus]|nr:MAG: prevent-host-death protein [Candidatus Eremiobacteraeota bacterium]